MSPAWFISSITAQGLGEELGICRLQTSGPVFLSNGVEGDYMSQSTKAYTPTCHMDRAERSQPLQVSPLGEFMLTSHHYKAKKEEKEEIIVE